MHFLKLFFHLEHALWVLAHFRPVKVLEHILIKFLFWLLSVWLFSGLSIRFLFFVLRFFIFIFGIFFLTWFWNSSKFLDLRVYLMLNLLNIVSGKHRLFMMSSTLALVIYFLYLFFFLINYLMSSLYGLFCYPFFSLANLLNFFREFVNFGPYCFIIKFSLWMMLLSVLIRS